MDSKTCFILLYLSLRLLFYGVDGFQEKRYLARSYFFGYRPVSTVQKYCSCTTPYSCSCCQSVIILYTKAEKNLCMNFTYQMNGLNLNVTLNSATLMNKTITDYKPSKICVDIPGCYFSTACVNILELNKFPRSITICPRLDILTKKRIWQLLYDCISVSTELPMMPANSTMATMTTTQSTGGMSTTMMPVTTSMMASSKMMSTATTTMMTSMMTTMMTTMMTGKSEETTTPRDVEMITEPGTNMTMIDDIDLL